MLFRSTTMAFWRKKNNDPEAANPAGENPDAVTPEVSPQEMGARSDQSGVAKQNEEAISPQRSGGLLSKMRGALSKTRQALNTDIRDLFKAEGRLVDDEFLDELFSRLIRTDMGVGPAETIRDDVAKRLRARVVQLEEVLQTITTQTQSMLEQESSALKMAESGPTVILVVGVNGSGKTTSIGKLANLLQKSGKRVVLEIGRAHV